MASSRPNVSDGFLGAQPSFRELKLETDSHKEAEFKVKGDNNVVIRFKNKTPAKVVTKLTQCQTDKELPEYVLVQRKDKQNIRFHVAFPSNGYYKFMIFALEESDSKESLPNVFNYMIHVENLGKPARPYPKVYSKFYKDSCYLDEPLVLHSNSKNLDKVKFELTVPHAEKVAVHCGEEWFQLTQKGNEWQGTANLSKYAGKRSRVQVMACYSKDGTSYDALLEYTI